MNTDLTRKLCTSLLLLVVLGNVGVCAQEAQVSVDKPVPTESDPVAALNAAISAYTAAQQTDPAAIIRYRDAEGAVARELHRPDRARSVLDSVTANLTRERKDEIKATLEAYSAISDSYAQAFREAPADYEEEYLDSFAVMYNLFLANIKPITLLDLDAIPDDSADKQLLIASRMLVQATPRILLEILREDLAQNRFTEAHRPDAELLLQTLNARTTELFAD